MDQGMASQRTIGALSTAPMMSVVLPPTGLAAHAVMPSHHFC